MAELSSDYDTHQFVFNNIILAANATSPRTSDPNQDQLNPFTHLTNICHYYVPVSVLGTEVVAMSTGKAWLLWGSFFKICSIKCHLHTSKADTAHQSQRCLLPSPRLLEDLSQHATMRILPKVEHKMKLISHSNANQTTLNHLWFPPKFYCLGSCHFLFLSFTSFSSTTVNIQINSLNRSNALPCYSPCLPFGHNSSSSEPVSPPFYGV